MAESLLFKGMNIFCKQFPSDTIEYNYFSLQDGGYQIQTIQLGKEYEGTGIADNDHVLWTRLKADKSSPNSLSS